MSRFNKMNVFFALSCKVQQCPLNKLRIQPSCLLLTSVHRAEFSTKTSSTGGESKKIPSAPNLNGVKKRLDLTGLQEESRKQLHDINTPDVFQRNIENYIGTVKVPVGLVKVKVNGQHAQGEYHVPMATTEAALVASYSRGCSVINDCGGCNVAALSQVISRVPSFQFQNIQEALEFISWVKDNDHKLKQAGDATSNYARIQHIKPLLRGSCVDLHLSLRTGDAAGQNMCTISAEAVCEMIIENGPLSPQYWYLETSSSSDKKGSYGSIHNGRGIEVTGEVTIPKEILWSRLRVTPDELVAFQGHLISGNSLNGAVGSCAHPSNGLAAMFIACGQDVACIAESHVGLTQYRKTSGGDIQISLTLPCLILGTVGGGTSLPSQKACLEILGLQGSGNVMALAEVVLSVCLGGELSLMSAVVSHEFVRAHKALARGVVDQSKPSKTENDANRNPDKTPDC